MALTLFPGCSCIMGTRSSTVLAGSSWGTHWEGTATVRGPLHSSLRNRCGASSPEHRLC